MLLYLKNVLLRSKPVDVLTLRFGNPKNKKDALLTFISEDVSANLNALETLHSKFNTQLLLIESGGDNLAANYR